MRVKAPIRLLISLSVIILSVGSGATEELSFDENETEPVLSEDLYFDESEVETIYIEDPETSNLNEVPKPEIPLLSDPRNTPHILGLCYYERDCPRHLTKSLIAKAFDGDAKAIAKYTGRAAPRRPIPSVEVKKGACDELRKRVKEGVTQFVQSAQSINLLTNDSQCDLMLKSMSASDLYHKKLK